MKISLNKQENKIIEYSNSNVGDKLQKNVIKCVIEINSEKINNNIVIFNTDINNGINVYLNNIKINMIKDNNKWKYNFQKS